MMRTINLHGHLKKRFGPKHRFDVGTAAEALRALNCAFPGDFVTALQSGHYALVRGDKRCGMRLDLGLVVQMQLGMADLHLIPVAEGAANNTKGIVKTVLGTALIGAAIFMAPAGAGLLGANMGAAVPYTSGMVSWGNIAMVGLGVALSGVSTLMANATTSSNRTDESYAINGPSNGAQQGSAVSLIYGQCFVGSVSVSFDADIENIGAYQA